MLIEHAAESSVSGAVHLLEPGQAIRCRNRVFKG
jgi:hypothetical protein